MGDMDIFTLLKESRLTENMNNRDHNHSPNESLPQTLLHKYFDGAFTLGIDWMTCSFAESTIFYTM